MLIEKIDAAQLRGHEVFMESGGGTRARVHDVCIQTNEFVMRNPHEKCNRG